jgi:hypothetical protein
MMMLAEGRMPKAPSHQVKRQLLKMTPKSEARIPSQTWLKKEIEPTHTLSNSKCRLCLSMRGKNHRDGMNLMTIRMKERRASC